MAAALLIPDSSSDLELAFEVVVYHEVSYGILGLEVHVQFLDIRCLVTSGLECILCLGYKIGLLVVLSTILNGKF